MTSSVHTGHHYNLIINNSVEKAVRETTQICTTCLTVNDGKTFGICHQRFDDDTHRCKKLVAKTRSLILIPSVGVFNIRGGSRPEDRGASPRPRADLLQDLVPRNTLRSRAFEIVKSPVKFLALHVSQRNISRRLVEAIP